MTGLGGGGMMKRVMLIPTQEERYSKAPRITLLLCVMIPCAVAAWIGGYRDMLTLVFAFLQPVALPLAYLGVSAGLAMALSALLQGAAFFWLARNRRLSAKARLTICVTWGMAFAAALRFLMAWALWHQITGR